MAALVDKSGTIKHYPLEMFQNGVSKETRLSLTGKMDNGIPFLSSDSSMTSKKKKNRPATFEIQIKKRCLSLKAKDDALFKISSKRPAFLQKQ